MTETRVKDVFPLTNGIMTAIASAGEYTYSADADLRLIANCGRRCITPIIEMLLQSSQELSQDALTRLAGLILSEYKDTWDKIYTTLTLEYNPLSASQYTETENIAVQGENTGQNEEIQQDNVSTYDVAPDNFISDGKTTSNVTSTGKTASNTTRMLTKTSNNTSYKPVDLLKSEIDMRMQNKFLSRILEDVKNYIAMPIY